MRSLCSAWVQIRNSDNRSAALDQLDQQNHQRKHQQNMDEPAKRIRTHESNRPQNEQDYKDRPKHRYHLPVLIATVTTDHFDAALWCAVVRSQMIGKVKKEAKVLAAAQVTRKGICATKAAQYIRLVRALNTVGDLGFELISSPKNAHPR
jgi:hypothetical protein